MNTLDAFKMFLNKISEQCYDACTLKVENCGHVTEYYTSIEDFYIQNLCGYEVLIFSNYELRHLNTILATKKTYGIEFDKSQIILNSMNGLKFTFDFSSV